MQKIQFIIHFFKLNTGNSNLDFNFNSKYKTCKRRYGIIQKHKRKAYKTMYLLQQFCIVNGFY